MQDFDFERKPWEQAGNARQRRSHQVIVTCLWMQQQPAAQLPDGFVLGGYSVVVTEVCDAPSLIFAQAYQLLYGISRRLRHTTELTNLTSIDNH